MQLCLRVQTIRNNTASLSRKFCRYKILFLLLYLEFSTKYSSLSNDSLHTLFITHLTHCTHIAAWTKIVFLNTQFHNLTKIVFLKNNFKRERVRSV